jgi:ferrochelatase
MPNHTAIILIALGGPRSLEEVSLFMAAFTGRPAPPSVVSAVIDRYKLIGNKSPLPEMVKAQAAALKQELGKDFRVYEGFRYSQPTISESFQKAIKNGATRIIGLSMSPFETEATTGAYRSAFKAAGSAAIKKIFIPSWHDNQLFIEAWQERIAEGLAWFHDVTREELVIIFTSHSVPVRYIKEGDPYQKQIEETIKLVVEGLGIKQWRVAWQSKGARATEPWIEPDVESTLEKIAQEGHKAVLEVPIGFTSDHMETLYDIDIVHRAHALRMGLQFERAESLNTSPVFISALADVVKKLL